MRGMVLALHFDLRSDLAFAFGLAYEHEHEHEHLIPRHKSME